MSSRGNKRKKINEEKNKDVFFETDDYTTVEKLKKFINRIERDYAGIPKDVNKVELSFDFFMKSFFPKAQEKLNEQLKERYKIGFIEGRYTEAQEHKKEK